MRTIVSLVGARPQFVKEAMISQEVLRRCPWRHVLVHSGQHYDAAMSGAFFDQLSIQKPDHFLQVGSGSHGAMTAAVLERFETVLFQEKPDLVLVYGDTNTTVAGALAAAKLKIPVAHVESGIRQTPKDMPEEINRVVTDRLSRYLFTCSESAVENLRREGVENGVFNVGDVMYDLYKTMEPHFDGSMLERLELRSERFILTTLHRDFNVDDQVKLKEILSGLARLGLSLDLEIVFPAHPRTVKRIGEFGLMSLTKGLRIVEPMGYLQLMGLLKSCAFVVTDSGGLQKEAVFGGKRALVVMPDTGWRELVDLGWNRLVKPQADCLHAEGATMVHDLGEVPPQPYGDGSAASRIVRTIQSLLEGVSS